MERLLIFFKYFSKNRKHFLYYSGFSFIVGVLELFGVALTYPFILRILNNEKGNGVLNSPIFLAFVIILLFVLKNVFMIFYSYFQIKFVKAVEVEMNEKFINYFLTAPYSKVSKYSFSKKNNIMSFIVPNVINNYVLRLLNLNVNFFIFGFISFFLLIKFPVATLITIAIGTMLIVAQNKIFKPILAKLANVQSSLFLKYSQCSNELLLNLKGIRISNNEKSFFDSYKHAIATYTSNNIKNTFFTIIPPYIIEPCIIILLFVLLAVISLENYSEPDKLVASFALIVTAIFRLAPTLARIQVNLNGINCALPILDELLSICKEFELNNVSEIQQKPFSEFNNCMELQGISFEYEPNKPVLKDVNLEIKKGEFIGIVGLSGSGKTTLIDIISGLLTPQKGKILVDGKELTSPLNIGCIPQEFNIINGTIKENVAFGMQEINEENIIKALKQAQLYDFIEQNYEDGINAAPFSDNSGLSLGQRQRLAIARALYLSPDILILDEATSSLDLKTEDEICNVLSSLKGEKTIIAIAHRLSTIKSADKILFLQNSKITASGTFAELTENNEDFRELVRLADLHSES